MMRKIIALPVVLLLILVLTGCAGRDPDRPTPAARSSPTNTDQPAEVLSSAIPVTPTSQPTAVPQIPAPPGLMYCRDDGLWLVDQDQNQISIAPACWIDIAPDHKRACYEYKGDIWLIHLETAAAEILVNLTANLDQPMHFHGTEWSPNSQTVYYLASADGWSTDLWEIKLAGKTTRNLTQTPDRIEWTLQYWQYPNQLIFTSFQKDQQKGPGVLGYLTAIDPDGSGYQILSDTRLQRMPVISPDQESIALPGGTLYHWQDGVQTLAAEVDPSDAADEVTLDLPAWSPDSRQIAWTLSLREDDHWRSGIGIYDLETNLIQVLHPYPSGMGEGFPPRPLWSPDGQWLAVLIYDADEDQSGVWILAPDGSQEHYLGNVVNPVWSPDSSWLTVQKYDTSTWVVNMQDLEPMEVDLPHRSEIIAWIDPAHTENWIGLVNFIVGGKYTVTESGNQVNLRADPSHEAEILQQLRTGDEFTLLEGPYYDLETKTAWMKIQVEMENALGWVVENHTWYAQIDQ